MKVIEAKHQPVFQIICPTCLSLLELEQHDIQTKRDEDGFDLYAVCPICQCAIFYPLGIA